MKLKFRAELRKQNERGAWTYFLIEREHAQKLGQKGYIKVKGKIDTHDFKGIKIMPMGDGKYFFPVKEDIRSKIGKQKGDRVTVELEVDH